MYLAQSKKGLDIEFDYVEDDLLKDDTLIWS
jgi:hypothetical protein